MNSTTRVFYFATMAAILAFTAIADIAGNRLYHNEEGAIAIILGSVVIGATFSWGFHRWPEDEKQIGF